MHRAGSRISVLHVDASAELLDVSRSMLPSVEGRIEVSAVTNASAAVAELATADVDCVVADYVLPDSDGIELLERVRDTYPDLPFIVFTGQGSEGVAADAISAGVTDYVKRTDGREDWAVLANRIVNAVERRRAERRATRSQSHLQALTTHANDVILTVDCQGDVEYVNHAVSEVLGYEPTCLEGQPLSTILPAGSGDAPGADGFDVVQSTHGQGGVDLTGTRQDGGEVPLSASFSTFTLGGRRYYAGILRDVSHQRELERKLRETADLYRALVEQSLVGIMLADADGYRYVSPTAAEIMGYTQEEMASMDPLEHVVPEERDYVAEQIRRRLEGEVRESRYTTTLRHKEGHRVDVRAHGTRVEYKGEPAIITVIVDITEERERKRRLAESERRYRTIAENFPNGSVGLFNPDLRYEAVDGEAFEDLPKDPEDMVGERLRDIHSPDFVENALPHYEAVFEGESGVFEFEYQGRLARGRVIPIYEGDEVVNGLAMIQDITEERERKRRLAESERRYRTIAENFPNGSVGLFNRDLRYETATGEAFLDLDEVDPSGRLLRDVHTESFVENHLHHYEAVFEGESRVFEFDYEDRVFRCRVVPVYDGDEVVNGLAITQDVTEERERKRRLTESERRYRTIAENFPNGAVGLFNPDLRYEALAGMVFDNLDDDPEDMVDERLQDVHSPDFVENALPHYEAVFDGESGVFEFEFPDRAGRTRIGRGRVVPVYDGDEVVNGIALTQDVTEDRGRRDALERQNARLEQLVELLTSDIQRPLAVLEEALAGDRGPKDGLLPEGAGDGELTPTDVPVGDVHLPATADAEDDPSESARAREALEQLSAITDELLATATDDAVEFERTNRGLDGPADAASFVGEE